MYWNMEANVFNSRLHPININMRCIEMQAQRILDNPLARLTLTWDVLK